MSDSTVNSSEKLDFVTTFTTKRLLRAQLDNLELPVLESIMKRLNSYMDERRDRKVQEQREAEFKKARIAKMMKLMEEEGVTLEDLQNAPVKTRKSASGKPPKPRLPPKYHITVEGKLTTWSGMGRTPIPIKNYINGGGDLDDLLIQ